MRDAFLSVRSVHAPPGSRSLAWTSCARRISRRRRMDGQQIAHQIGPACARKAALGREAEYWDIFAGQFDAFVRPFNAVSGMDEPEIDLSVSRERKFPHGREVFVAGPRQRHR